MSLSRFLVSTTISAALLAAGHFSAASASRSPLPCPDFEPLEVDQPHTWEFSDQSAESSLVGVVVAEPGWLTVEVDTTAPQQLGAWWELWPTPCGAAASIADWGFDSGLIEVREPGTVHLRLGLVETSEPGEKKPVRLVTRYFPASQQPPKDGESGDDTEAEESEILPKDGASGDDTEAEESEILPKDGESGDDTEAEESEILPKDPAACGSVELAFFKDGESGDDTEAEESEILPKSGQGGCGCAAEPANDLMRCATPLRFGGSFLARIEAPRKDDRDYYSLVLNRAQKVRISTAGTTDTFGTLYDARGRRLTSADGGGEGENFAFEANLATGRYFVRVEGMVGSEGEYRLRVER